MSTEVLQLTTPISKSTSSPINYYFNEPHCAELPSFDHMTIFEDGVYIGASVELQCSTGHHFQDGTTVRSAECMSNSDWNHQVEDCIKLNDCNHEYIIESYRNTVPTEQALILCTFNTYVLFYPLSCVPEYGTYDVCSIQYNSWNIYDARNATDIAVNDCGYIPYLDDSYVQLRDDNTIEVICDAGYRMSNGHKSSIISCHQNEWISLDYIEVECHIQVCSPIELPLYAYINTKQALVGTVVTLRCEEGYKFINKTEENETSYNEITIECMDDDTFIYWSKFTTNITCELVQCFNITIIPHATIISETYDPHVNYTLGTILTFQCEGNKRFITGEKCANITCNIDGAWESGFVLDCEENRCLDIMTHINNTHYISPPTVIADIGSYVKLVCPIGMKTEDNNQFREIECLNDMTWSLISDCEAVYCKSLEVLRVDKTDRTFGSVVEIACVEGLTFDKTVVTHPFFCNTISQNMCTQAKCIENGSWYLTNNSMLLNTTEETQSYKIEDLEDICVEVDCNEPCHATHGTVWYKSTTYNQETHLRCLEGFWLRPKLYSVMLKCNQSGRWTSNFEDIDMQCPYECRPVICPKIILNIEETINTTLNSYQTFVNYTCLEDFSTDKFASTDTYTSTVHICNVTGKWDPPIKCKPPEDKIVLPIVEAPSSDKIGMFAISIVISIIVLLIILDILTLDLKEIQTLLYIKSDKNGT